MIDFSQQEPHIPVAVDVPRRAHEAVVQLFNAYRSDDVRITTHSVYTVWFCYILGGWKALCSTTVPDGMYYEVTYDKDKKCTYVDAYRKVQNRAIPD